MGHVLRLGNRSIVYSEVRYRYLLLKSRRSREDLEKISRFRNHRKCNLLSLILLFFKYLTSCQHKLIDNKNPRKIHSFLDSPKFVPFMDKLSADLQKDRLKPFAIMHIRFRTDKSTNLGRCCAKTWAHQEPLYNLPRKC